MAATETTEETSQRTRRTRPSGEPERVPCAWCGKLMYPGRHRSKRFCSEAHRQAAYRARKAEREQGAVLRHHDATTRAAVTGGRDGH